MILVARTSSPALPFDVSACNSVHVEYVTE
jgi:hypothetical protein